MRRRGSPQEERPLREGGSRGAAERDSPRHGTPPCPAGPRSAEGRPGAGSAAPLPSPPAVSRGRSGGLSRPAALGTCLPPLALTAAAAAQPPARRLRAGPEPAHLCAGGEAPAPRRCCRFRASGSQLGLWGGGCRRAGAAVAGRGRGEARRGSPLGPPSRGASPEGGARGRPPRGRRGDGGTGRPSGGELRRGRPLPRQDAGRRLGGLRCAAPPRGERLR